jgi:polysaccharide pyruvyl transferase WcaK-like protein
MPNTELSNENRGSLSGKRASGLAELEHRKGEHNRGVIALFGHFGAGNIGNESTLQAMLSYIRRLMPNAKMICICSAPEIVSESYRIPTVPIREIVVTPRNFRNPVARLARKLLIGLPCELYRWTCCARSLCGADMLIVVGTGLLTDAFGIHSWGPYNMFKWAVVARLCGCQLMFVSVGAGPLECRTSRLLVKTALSLASFRSYRDGATLRYLKAIGVQRDSDRVYPDLAFSLCADPHRRDIAAQGRRSVVGIGLMVFGGMYGIDKTTSAHYAAYLETLVGFVRWLLDREYDIRLLIGDFMDVAVTRQFKSLLVGSSATHEEERIIAEPIASPEDLLSQLAATDFVVATRFHNVLLALLLNKPSIAISFHHKCSSLMDEAGLSDYCQDIKNLNIARLIDQFCHLEADAVALKQMLRAKVSEYSKSLDEQYRLIFKDRLEQTTVEDTSQSRRVAPRL